MSFYRILACTFLIAISSFIIAFAWQGEGGETKSHNRNLISIQVNPAKTYQKIDGFGASDAWRAQFIGKNWPLKKREKMADLLFSQAVDSSGNPKGIGLSIWRFYIGAGSKEQGENSGIANEWRRGPSFMDAEGNWNWNKYQGQRWFLDAAQKRGVNQFLAFTISPPVFMTKNGKAFSPGGSEMNIRKDKMDDYADFLVEIMDHFHNQKNVSFDYLSPINEPQWKWDDGGQEGTPATNKEIHKFVKLLSEGLSKRGLSTEIVLGEAAKLNYLSEKTNDRPQRSDQIASFFDPRSKYYIGDYPNIKHTVSGHSYFTTWPPDTLIYERERLSSKIREVDSSLGYWQSEYCILQQNDDINGGNERDLGMDTALYVARVIHYDLTIANASSWQWWTALTQFDYKDGLIYLDAGDDGVTGIEDPAMESLKYDGNFHDSKTLWALGNYSRFIRPGMKRIEVKNLTEPEPLNQAKNLMISGYTEQKSGKLILVFINYSNSNQQAQIANLGEDFSIEGDFASYTTSASKNLEKEMIASDKVNIPAKSVVTLSALLE